MEQWLTVRQVVQQTGKAERTVRAWITQGRVQSRLEGKSRLILAGSWPAEDAPEEVLDTRYLQVLDAARRQARERRRLERELAERDRRLQWMETRLEQAETAGRELRLLHGQAVAAQQATVRELAAIQERLALPPPRKWWRLWG